MSIHSCSIKINDRKQELTKHGTPMFPCGCYISNVDDTVTGDIPWHWHEEIELVIIYQGAACITAGCESYILKEGEGAFINSNIMHSGYSMGEEKCILHSFVFHPNLICGSLDNVFMQKYIIPLVLCSQLSGIALKKDNDWKSKTLNYISLAYEAYHDEEFGYEFTIRDLLSKVCILIVKDNQTLLPIQGKSNTQETDRVKIMLNYIHQHYFEPLELMHIAECVNVSRRECLRSFQETLGISPMQYLIKYRVSTSAQILIETKLNVTEICEKCGFTSSSYFSKMFKRLIGCSPTEYRKQNK